eukprot:365974-Chlamydomonas_euryale.AAC.5
MRASHSRCVVASVASLLAPGVAVAGRRSSDILCLCCLKTLAFSIGISATDRFVTVPACGQPQKTCGVRQWDVADSRTSIHTLLTSATKPPHC